MNMSEQDIRRLAVGLANRHVEPGVRYCGQGGCQHPGGEHSGRNNRCLVCECVHFAERSMESDLAVAIRLAVDAS